MIVVSDTSPLNYLAILGLPQVLAQLFGEVVVPPAVALELADAAAPQPTRALIQNPPNWLSVRRPSDSTVRALRATAPKLGAGEIEAISLAKDLGADLLLTDERRATREAREKHHLRVTGLLGVLERAAVRHLIDLPRVIAQLEQTSFRMPRETVSRLLRDHSQRTRDRT